MTTYETLQNAVNAALNTLNAEKAKLNGLRNDPQYLQYKATLPTLLFAQKVAAENYIRVQEGKIDQQILAVQNAEQNFANAQNALTSYEKNSPIGAAIVSSKNAEAANKKTVTIVIAIVVVAIVVAGVVWFIRKKKKNG